MKLGFLSADIFSCSVQNMSFLGGKWRHASQENILKIHALTMNLVLSEAQNCYARERLWEVY